MYIAITLDGNYAVKKFLLNTPANINLNWVDKLRIEQEFKRMPDSTWVLANENTYVNFYIVKGAQQLYAHQLRNFDKYQFHGGVVLAGIFLTFRLDDYLGNLERGRPEEHVEGIVLLPRL